jgi:hypothetical protein
MAHSAHARDNHWRRAELRDTNWRHSRYRPVGAAAVEWIWATLAVMSVPGLLHHIEIWVTNLHIAERSWGWLPAELGYSPCQAWSHGRSWSLDSTYIVIEQSPDVRPQPHDRLAADLNHLAFHAGTEADVDRLTAEAASPGWVLLFEDRHPHAGGPDHYAAYLENVDGFEVELCGTTPG